MNQHSEQPTKRHLDIMIIVPLPEEHDALQQIFEPGEDLSDQEYIVSLYDVPGSTVSVASILQPAMGKSAAMETVRYAESRFDVNLYVVLGIAGSLSSDNALGDVCYSGTVYDITNNIAAGQTDSGQLTSALSPNVYHSNERLIRSLAFFRNHPQTKAHFVKWKDECSIWLNLLAEQLNLDISAISHISDSTSVRVGPIVSGPVIKSTVFKNQLLELDRKMLAIETESGGVYEFLKGSGKQENVLVIRGICDFADIGKSRLEKETKGLLRQCAAINAALFLLFQLKCKPFVQAVEALKHSQLPLPQLSTADPTDTDQLEGTIQSISEEVNERLNDLSPEYRLKPNGYVLPAPRFRRDPLNTIGVPLEHSPAENITDILDENRVVWVKVDHSYPDDSLPWVIAQHLLRQELGEQFIIPLVVEGSQIRPPTGTIRNQIDVHKLGGANRHHGTTLVVIVANPNLSTENSRRYLSRQIEENSDARFVLVTRDDFHVDDPASSLGAAGGRKYLVDKVSFQELVTFLQSAFRMEAQKAEVLAQRLDDIFSRFDLLAHPTYFAGIPEAMLNAFLQANRRSELIQLAVDGFLTFLVAEDKADVILSRTTRQKFLSIVVYEMNVELARYRKLDLVQKAAEFARDMDYEIDEARFVDDFFRKGILREEDGWVIFALPFVERYLLALELRRRGEKAQLTYFDFDPETFDVSTGCRSRMAIVTG